MKMIELKHRIEIIKKGSLNMLIKLSHYHDDV